MKMQSQLEMPPEGKDPPYLTVRKPRRTPDNDRHSIWQEKVEWLLQVRFPSRPSDIRSAYKHQNSSILDFVSEIERKIRDQYVVYSNYLNSLTEEELNEHYREEWNKKYVISTLTRDEYIKSLPFNQPEASADFDHYSRMASWTIDETSALLIGKDPRRVCERDFRRNTDTILGEKYVQVRDLLLNATAVGDLKSPYLPRDIHSWAKRIELEIPAELVDMVNWRHSHTFDWRKRCTDREEQLLQLKEKCEAQETRIFDLQGKLDLLYQIQKSADEPINLARREKQTFQKMVLAMAINKFGFDPNRRNTTSNLIMNAVEMIGLNLNDDTIRTKLREAVLDLDFTLDK